MSTPPILATSTHTCKDYAPECIGPTQKLLLYAGLAMIAVGVAGNMVSVKPFLVSQTTDPASDDDSARHPLPRVTIYHILGLIGTVVVSTGGAIALVYIIKPWTLRFWIPAGVTAFATFLFLTGSWTYKQEEIPGKSPISNVCRVFVAAALNMFQRYPDREAEMGFSKTSCLRGLHKAVIVREGNTEENRLRRCSVEEVEEAKIAVRMIPMWMTFILCGVVASAGDTYFVEQAGKLDRSMGKLKVPIQILLAARSLTGFFMDLILGKVFKMREICTSLPSIGIGFGMTFSILCCISAAGVEKMRLNAVRKHGLLDKPDDNVPFSIYWLLFQFILLGALDSFMEMSVNLYYEQQSPESMENYLEHFTRGVSGLGYMSGVLCVYVVGRISERGGKRNWFQETLNTSRLDRYFWVLAALSTVNFVVFGLVASRYRYKEPRRRENRRARRREMLLIVLLSVFQIRIKKS